MSRMPFIKALTRDKALLTASNVSYSRDSLTWYSPSQIEITDIGQIVAHEEIEPPLLLALALQACHVSIHLLSPLGPVLNGRRRFAKKTELELASYDEPPVIFIRLYDNEKLFLRIASKTTFGMVLLALMAWQNMKPAGLAKKWYAENASLATVVSDDPHEVLVGRFRIFGPIPAKVKNLKLVKMPRPPPYQLPYDTDAHSDPSHASGTLQGHEGSIPEGWFYTMGVLKSNGTLNFISELDGTLLYSIDIKSILLLEIREVHHSICDSSNILFIGHIRDLRWNNVLKSTTALTLDLLNQLLPSFLVKDGKPVANNSRVLIDFPLHIDLEDWFVGLNYFCKREYIGMYDKSLALRPPPTKHFIDIDLTIDHDSTLDGTETPRNGTPNTTVNPNGLSHVAPHQDNQHYKLSDYLRDHLRVSKKLTVDIIEAKFDHPPALPKDSNKIYAEVVMWGFPWARTAFVQHTSNPFWKENFLASLPILTQMVHIVIKKCVSNKNVYSPADKVVGTVYLTPDVLTQQRHTFSTMMNLNVGGNTINVPGHTANDSLGVAAATIANNNNSVRLSIYDATNLPIGKLLLTVDLKEYLIPNPSYFKPLEHMLKNCPMKELIEFCNNAVLTSEFENVSFILLDIFQSLGIEDRWFKTLVEAELVDVDKMTRKNYASKGNGNSTSSNNVFNTLFRGSSIFTKSLEKYIFRIGQEYLEKVFGDLFEKITMELLNCEIDPRYVRQQEAAKRKRAKHGANYNSTSDSEDDSDEDVDAETEKKREEQVKEIIDKNYKALTNYAEQLWYRIYSTSNDLPEQIKLQLKNFRTKVDFACDPEDKTTALNCLSAFIFLRFFCPAILNPKLFYLTKNHQTGNAQRTLTLIAKILLNLANRQEFSQHKEPHLVRMNKFLQKHQDEMYDYFDKITGRKNDFNEKILDLSHEVNRFDLGLGGDASSSELPTTPYLIDKYLRLTELIHLLKLSGHSRSQSQKLSSASTSSITTMLSSLTVARSNTNTPAQNIAARLPFKDNLAPQNDEILMDGDRNTYQIGSLEFEKSEFLDLAGDNETEGFIKSLCRSNEEIFSFITSNISLKDLQKQSTDLINRIDELSHRLEEPEICENLQHDPKLWEAFVDKVVDTAIIDVAKSSVVFYDENFQGAMVPGQKRIRDNGITALKLKFPVEMERTLMSESFSSNSLGSLLRTPSKNPFKRWLKKE